MKSSCLNVVVEVQDNVVTGLTLVSQKAADGPLLLPLCYLYL